VTCRTAPVRSRVAVRQVRVRIGALPQPPWPSRLVVDLSCSAVMRASRTFVRH
jgi:hypothetical protein